MKRLSITAGLFAALVSPALAHHETKTITNFLGKQVEVVVEHDNLKPLQKPPSFDLLTPLEKYQQVYASVGYLIAAENACSLPINSDKLARYVTSSVPSDQLDAGQRVVEQTTVAQLLVGEMTPLALTVFCNQQAQIANGLGVLK